jgi:hypothetical protein
MLGRAFLVVFIVSMLAVSLGQQARATGAKTASLKPILEVLDRAKLSGSLEFSGSCDLRDFPDFPQFRDSATSGGLPLQTVRDMLADDSAMQVMQDPDGTIRMIESGVPTDLLNVRISHILFESNGANGQRAIYSPNVALRYILQAPEVVAFMKAHDIGWPYVGEAVPGNAGARPSSWPHISGSLDNVTLSEALDRVLKTFPGIWIYENCPQSDKRNRIVYFRFSYLRKIGPEVPVE